eukprot:953699-Alexandrium_andersonii.AAC.1
MSRAAQARRLRPRRQARRPSALLGDHAPSQWTDLASPATGGAARNPAVALPGCPGDPGEVAGAAQAAAA